MLEKWLPLLVWGNHIGIVTKLLQVCLDLKALCAQTTWLECVLTFWSAALRPNTPQHLHGAVFDMTAGSVGEQLLWQIPKTAIGFLLLDGESVASQTVDPKRLTTIVSSL